MNYYEAIEAFEDAERTLRLADTFVEKALPLIVGRLRNAKSYRANQALCDLKRELRNFNMNYHTWKQ